MSGRIMTPEEIIGEHPPRIGRSDNFKTITPSGKARSFNDERGERFRARVKKRKNKRAQTKAGRKAARKGR